MEVAVAGADGAAISPHAGKNGRFAGCHHPRPLRSWQPSKQHRCGYIPLLQPNLRHLIPSLSLRRLHVGKVAQGDLGGGKGRPAAAVLPRQPKRFRVGSAVACGVLQLVKGNPFGSGGKGGGQGLGDKGGLLILPHR